MHTGVRGQDPGSSTAQCVLGKLWAQGWEAGEVSSQGSLPAGAWDLSLPI